MGTLKYSIILYLIVFQYAIGQEDPRILWEPEVRLNWTNFKGNPPGPSPIAAITASGISYEYNARPVGDEYILDFKIQTYFYPQKSWYRPESCNEVTLAHEQLHFDISELYARKMRSILSRRRFGRNVKAEVRKIFKQINKEMTAFQDRYDQETDFSRNREVQFLWNEKILEILATNRYPK